VFGVERSRFVCVRSMPEMGHFLFRVLHLQVIKSEDETWGTQLLAAIDQQHESSAVLTIIRTYVPSSDSPLFQ
jgi:hypothetical protein